MWAAEESCRQEGVIEVCIGRVRLATRQLFYCVAPKQSLFLLDATIPYFDTRYCDSTKNMYLFNFDKRRTYITC